MLRNYFKTAIAVLKRRKFFTFISLFGISFTLTLLILIASLVDSVLSVGYPDFNRSRELFVNHLQLTSTKNGSNISGGPSFYFFEHYVSRLKTQEKLAVFSGNKHTTSYTNNKKLVLNLKYTDDRFWEVLQFQFVEGRPYSKQQLDNGENLAIITEDTRDNYFGKQMNVVGKYIETDNIQYRVAGVVRGAPQFGDVYADIYVPYTLSKTNIHNAGLGGDYSGILLLHDASDISAMKKEFDQMVSKIPAENTVFDIITITADTYFENFARNITGEHNGDTGIKRFFLSASLFLLLFLLLPTLNLININISRIMDRYSEIGVRKAFGASAGTLVYQFVVENLILTLMGGVLGILFSFILLQVVNYIRPFANVELTLSFNVFFFSIITCLFFGLISGVYPAWRMSKMQVVTALKSQ